jgi:ophiobolin F synthase
MEPPTPDELEIWVHSRLVDSTEVRNSGCFTTLPVRINLYDDVADAAARRLSQEWKELLDDQVDGTTSKTSSPVGNMSSFFYPECTPDRVDIIAYLNELAFIQDGLCTLNPSLPVLLTT